MPILRILELDDVCINALCVQLLVLLLLQVSEQCMRLIFMYLKFSISNNMQNMLKFEFNEHLVRF